MGWARLNELRGGDPLPVAQELHAHVTIEDHRNHLQSAAAGVIIDAAGLDDDAPRSSVQHQYWHSLTLSPVSAPSRHKFLAAAQPLDLLRNVSIANTSKFAATGLEISCAATVIPRYRAPMR